MALQKRTITNPKTGQDIKFLLTGKDTNGQLLEMEATYHPYSKEPAAHYHPLQVEDFTVLSGQLTVRIDNQVRILNQGDTLHIPENKVHAMWNNSESKTIINWKVQPAMNSDSLLETVFRLASEGKTNSKGVPNIFHSALIITKYSDVFRLAKPTYFIQKIVFWVLIPFAYLFGYTIKDKHDFD